MSKRRRKNQWAYAAAIAKKKSSEQAIFSRNRFFAEKSVFKGEIGVYHTREIETQSQPTCQLVPAGFLAVVAASQGFSREFLGCPGSAPNGLGCAESGCAGHSERPLCHCLRVSAQDVQGAISNHDLSSVREVTRACGAGGGCMGCHRRLKQMLAEHAQRRQCLPASHADCINEPAFA